VDSGKLETELGWRPETKFAEGLRETIDWYVANPGWRERIKSQAYRSYYREQYEQRDETLRRIQNPGGG
jgi:dTDP-glucose 4,6-dehydratase